MDSYKKSCERGLEKKRIVFSGRRPWEPGYPAPLMAIASDGLYTHAQIF